MHLKKDGSCRTRVRLRNDSAHVAEAEGRTLLDRLCRVPRETKPLRLVVHGEEREANLAGRRVLMIDSNNTKVYEKVE